MSYLWGEMQNEPRICWFKNIYFSDYYYNGSFVLRYTKDLKSNTFYCPILVNKAWINSHRTLQHCSKPTVDFSKYFKCLISKHLLNLFGINLFKLYINFFYIYIYMMLLLELLKVNSLWIMKIVMLFKRYRTFKFWFVI